MRRENRQETFGTEDGEKHETYLGPGPRKIWLLVLRLRTWGGDHGASGSTQPSWAAGGVTQKWGVKLEGVLEMQSCASGLLPSPYGAEKYNIFGNWESLG